MMASQYLAAPSAEEIKQCNGCYVRKNGIQIYCRVHYRAMQRARFTIVDMCRDCTFTDDAMTVLVHCSRHAYMTAPQTAPKQRAFQRRQPE